MNWYLDFDHTLYDSQKLTKDMLDSICNNICKSNVSLNKIEILEEIQNLFHRDNIYNIYEVVKYLSKKYNLNEIIVKQDLNNVILNGSQNVFSDVLEFLKRLKNAGNSIFMLSYYEYGLEYQTTKIAGSGLCNLFDGLYITGKHKYDLDINYSNGIFVDDKPEDLKGLSQKNPMKLIRIKRHGQKYSENELFLSNNFEEIYSFDEITF